VSTKPKFTTTSVFGYKEYLHYSITEERQHKFTWSVMLIFELVCIVMAYYYWSLKDSHDMGTAFILLAVFFPIAMGIRVWLGIRFKYNRKMKKMEGTKNVFSFYDNAFEAKNEQSKTLILYKDIYNILITTTNIYIVDSKSRSYILDRENCSNELVEFLSRMALEIRHKDTKKFTNRVRKNGSVV
jgi:hypothetical protein